VSFQKGEEDKEKNLSSRQGAIPKKVEEEEKSLPTR
jgi:hypothetical protein